MPWYRRVWVIVVGAVLIAVLSFGSGFIAGSAASLFDGLFGGPTRGLIDGGPGFRDGVPTGRRRIPADAWGHDVAEWLTRGAPGSRRSRDPGTLPAGSPRLDLRGVVFLGRLGLPRHVGVHAGRICLAERDAQPGVDVRPVLDRALADRLATAAAPDPEGLVEALLAAASSKTSR